MLETVFWEKIAIWILLVVALLVTSGFAWIYLTCWVVG